MEEDNYSDEFSNKHSSLSKMKPDDISSYQSKLSGKNNPKLTDPIKKGNQLPKNMIEKSLHGSLKPAK